MSESITDPSKRYLRREEISRTNFCVEYRAIDQSEGTEVLWHELSIGTSAAKNSSLIQHVVTLGKVKHPNIIGLYHAWLDKGRNICFFLTEYFANQTLSSYVQNVGHNLTRTAIGNWCAQVMDALDVLHSISPPFIHGDVRCENMFIDPSEGVVKLGLPDFEIFLSNEVKPMQSPEAQKYVNDPKNDVWALGMAVLEMATSKIPFGEIHSEMQLREAISSGIMPPEFLLVDDPIIADFIQTCVLPLLQRPTVSQLRDHPLFAEIELSEGSGRKQTNEEGAEYREISGDIRKRPEFAALLQKQNIEKAEIIQKHELQRKALQEKIRQKLGK